MQLTMQQVRAEAMARGIKGAMDRKRPELMPEIKVCMMHAMHHGSDLCTSTPGRACTLWLSGHHRVMGPCLEVHSYNCTCELARHTSFTS